MRQKTDERRITKYLTILECKFDFKLKILLRLLMKYDLNDCHIDIKEN